jgi:DHA2 family multidrug resistance protein
MTSTTTSVSPRRFAFMELTGAQWLILVMIQLSNMLFSMTITIANLVLPQVRGALSATQDEISWVITLNLMATAIVTPLTAWLAGRFGWRNMLFGTVAGFTLASAVCGLANNLETLIFARVMQGAFGAPIAPLGQAILLATFPRHLQPFALVMWGVGSVFGPVVGPILGAMATEAWNWRAAFLMIVPPGILTLICIWVALRSHTTLKKLRFDWLGFLALACALLCAQLVFDRGQKLDWFESPVIIACTFLGGLSFWMFIVQCMTAEQPFLNPSLLLDRNFAVGTFIAFIVGMLSFTSLVLFPTLLHDLRGYPEDAISTLIAARGLGNWTAFLFISQLTRIAPRFAIAAGFFIQAAGSFWMSQFDINVTETAIFWSHYMMGLGNSVVFTPMAVMAFSTLPRDHITEGSAVFTMTRNFGSSLFISMSVLVFLRSKSISYSELAEFITPFRFVTNYPGTLESWDLGSVAGLMGLSGEIGRQAAMVGYINAFLMMALTAAAAIPLALLLRRPSQE